MRSLYRIVFVLAVIALAGCASIGETPAQKVFAATSTYDAGLTAAVAYKNLPPCGQPASPTICSDKEVVATLQKADNVAFEALSSAQKVVRDTKATQPALQTAVAWATEAAAAFNRIATALK